MAKKQKSGGQASASVAVLEVQKFAEEIAQKQRTYRDTQGSVGPGQPAYLTGGNTPNVDVLPQGDLYLMVIDEKVFKVSKDGQTAEATINRNRAGSSEPMTIKFNLLKKPQLQLVPGHTSGSKHCLADAECVDKMYLPEGWNVDSFFGPVFQLKADKTGTITHPTHGYIHIDAGLLVFAFYQRNQEHELRLERRAAD